MRGRFKYDGEFLILERNPSDKRGNLDDLNSVQAFLQCHLALLRLARLLLGLVGLSKFGRLVALLR